MEVFERVEENIDYYFSDEEIEEALLDFIQKQGEPMLSNPSCKFEKVDENSEAFAKKYYGDYKFTTTMWGNKTRYTGGK